LTKIEAAQTVARHSAQGSRALDRGRDAHIGSPPAIDCGKFCWEGQFRQKDSTSECPIAALSPSRVTMKRISAAVLEAWVSANAGRQRSRLPRAENRWRGAAFSFDVRFGAHRDSRQTSREVRKVP